MAEQKPTPANSVLTGIPLAMAVFAVLIWIAFVVVMLLSAGSTDVVWTRMTFVFSSVEAIAFAAAGALFGVTVQRERVKSAEERAETNAKDAANGRALAAITIADAADPGEQLRGSGYQEESFGSSAPSSDNVRRRHAEAASRLFPEFSTLSEGARSAG